MIAVALKGLAGRKVRALLTAFAVVIGVSMVSGTFVLTDTMQKAFDGIFTASYDETDAVIAGKQIVEGSTSGSAPRCPSRCSRKVRALPEVAAAGGTIGGDESFEAEIIGRDGKARSASGGAPTLAPRLRRRTRAVQPAEAAVRRVAAGPGAGRHRRRHGRGGALRGRRLRRRLHARRAGSRYKVTGIATFGDVDSLGGADPWPSSTSTTAQTLLHKEGRFDGISIAAKDGTSPARARRRRCSRCVPADLRGQGHRGRRPRPSGGGTRACRFIRYFLLGFGGIALFVGAFVIFNTLSITVAQRTREFATLRTLGASRKQVMRSVVHRGPRASGCWPRPSGSFAGIGIAKGMNALFKAMGTDLPEAGTVIARAHGHRLARARRRDHAASPASCPRGGRPASRRSPRSARARRCRRRASPRTRSRRPSASSSASVAAICAGVFAAG